MRWTIPTRFDATRFALTRFDRRAVAMMLAAMSVAGCHGLINPWSDETVSAQAVTTASVSAARAQITDPDVQLRDFSAVPLHPQDGSVRHFPLWFEDPFEDRGSDDGRFAWTYEDYIAAPYGLARSILNGIAVPISAIVRPPAPLMMSDGLTSRQALGYDHDADWRPDGATPVPPDLIELGADDAGAVNSGG